MSVKLDKIHIHLKKVSAISEVLIGNVGTSNSNTCKQVLVTCSHNGPGKQRVCLCRDAGVMVHATSWSRYVKWLGKNN